ncbi:MAG: hypothetical protein CMH36_08855 [Microbacterium sp.]|uniref:hypothetical protein n=1 Tax=uncultured Microbacterium sp. TaxID=191216 RepID=UPI000C8F1EA2|nr:hypothetical protein [Microbacterium sp.]
MTDAISEILLWADSETDGLHDDCDLLELAVIVTDTELNELESFATVVKPTAAALRRISTDDVLRAMHTKSGLLADLHAIGDLAPTTADVETRLLEIIGRWKAAGVTTFQIAGGGVSHFDQHHFATWMPAFSAELYYRPVDISQFAEVYRRATGDRTFDKRERKAHRADADIRQDLEIARRVWPFLRDAVLAGLHAPRTGDEALGSAAELLFEYSAATANPQEFLARLQGFHAPSTLAGMTHIAASLVASLATASGSTPEDVLRAALRQLSSEAKPALHAIG